MKKLQNAGLRCEMDQRTEKIGYKIREARMERVPYILVVGEKEQELGHVSVRNREDGDLGCMSVEEFLDMVLSEK